jgi:hypothetical protein
MLHSILRKIVNRHQRLFNPAWVLNLSNEELGEAFGETYEEAGARWEALSAADKAAKADNWIEPNIEHRLNVLYDEISRREHAGMWTEEDWEA